MQKEKWTKQDIETFAEILGIIAMILLIPAIFFYDWLNNPVNWIWLVNLFHRLLERIMNRQSLTLFGFCCMMQEIENRKSPPLKTEV